MRDVIVIGAGVTGASVARALSAYEADVLVLDQECEMGMGTSKANSALVHAGFDAEPGSRKAEFNGKGSRMMEALCRELDVPYRRNGAMVLAFSEEEEKTLRELYDRGVANGVERMRLLSAQEVRQREPNVSAQATGALLAETAALVCPFQLTTALCENAFQNGVSFRFQERVTGIARREDGSYRVTTGRGSYDTAAVVNCAGLYADMLHNLVSARRYHITPVRGEYCLLDRSEGELVHHTLFRVPTKRGKGVLVTQTVHGNLLLGPTACAAEDKDDTATTGGGLRQVLEETAAMVNGIDTGKIITSFAGLRAHEDGGDFVLGEAEDAPGFYDALGIESPGLSAAPAIGVYLAELLAQSRGWKKRPDFSPYRTGIPAFSRMTPDERREQIRRDPAYGEIVCRCEEVTAGEIREAIRRPLGARTLDGVKRRVRAGMGRCQGGFCMPKVAQILAEELGIDLAQVQKAGEDSPLLLPEGRGSRHGTV